MRRSGLSRSLLRGLLVLIVVLATGSYYWRVPGDPPGFSIDESSISYNAYEISQNGCDEYGNPWPLFFRAFGEYKNPTIIYILAALFRLTGPGILVARALTATLGVLTGLLLGLLTWKMTSRWVAAAIVIITTLLTPWLFESSRLVFEVALYPGLVALFLLAVWRASLRRSWSWSDVLTLTAALGLLSYSYSIGRLLAPLLALGLGLFINRRRWRGVLWTWGTYGLLLVPMLVFHRQHPDALTGRFRALTYLTSGKSAATNIGEFARHYLANINSWRWLVTGEADIRDHLQGFGSLLAATVLLAILGLVIVLRQHRRDPWWRFIIYGLVIAPVPASLTSNPFPQLRLIAFPIFLLLFLVPAINWLTETNGLQTTKRILLAVSVGMVLVQGFLFQQRYHQNAPTLWYVFDARFPRKVLAPALATKERLITLLDEPGKAGYIHALWYGALAHLEPGRLTRLPLGERPQPGSVVISTEQECHDCRLMARALNYIVYRAPPYPDGPATDAQPLAAFQAHIVCENPPSTLVTGEPVVLRFLIKNISPVEWPAAGNNAVSLENRWRDQAGAILADRDASQSIPFDVEPGDTVGLVLKAAVPANPGDYVIEVDLAQKNIAWFSERGSTAWRRQVKVVAND
ncbi:MAG: hypothetical protein ACJ8NS_13405 [Chthoniobacterales bacterium]